MSNGGWIKLWRKARSNPWLQDAVQRSVFITLLLDAEAEPRERRHAKGVVMVKRGQAVISTPALAKELKVGRQQIRRALANLKNGGLINQRTNQHFTLVNICNYDEYQSSKPKRQPARQPATQPTANQQPTTLLEEEEGEEGEKVGAQASNGSIPRKKPAVPMPQGWTPDIEYARSKGLTDGEINTQANKFVYSAEQHDRRYVNWDAAWRTWILNHLEWREQRRTH